MAALKPSLLCASLGLLLLMIGVIATPLPQVQARPSDFWCNSQARKNMERRIEGLQTDMVRIHAQISLSMKSEWDESCIILRRLCDLSRPLCWVMQFVAHMTKLPSCLQVHCVGFDTLSSPVQLPCVWVHTAEWVNKTVSNTRLNSQTHNSFVRSFTNLATACMPSRKLSCPAFLYTSTSYHGLYVVPCWHFKMYF